MDTPAAGVHYRVEVDDAHAHLFGVTLTIAEPAREQTVSLPVWIPGSYLIREFARHLQCLKAYQGRRSVALRQLDKHRWVAQTQAGQPLVLRYQVYAFDTSVRTAWLDATRGFFNGSSLFLRVHGHEDQPHDVEIVAPESIAGWAVATGAAARQIDENGFGNYTLEGYDALVDCPVEMGPFWSGEFSACGVAHRVVVSGAPPSFDSTRLLADTQAICEAAIRLWHGKGRAPHRSYVFLLNAVHDGYGGLEHRNSTALLCNRSDLPRLPHTLQQDPTVQPAGYTRLRGLISHEYFHTWCVKRLRPAEFAAYDYDSENYTRLLWFFEGFTSYYDDLLLLRSGCIDTSTYLQVLSKAINQVAQSPGRTLQSVAQASFDAWIKYYRQDENTPNATVSYYTKGALVALCLDLRLRQEGSTSLDAVMRALWQRCSGGPMSEQDLLDVLQAVSGRSYAAELRQWVHGTAELPLQSLLAQQGLALDRVPASIAQSLGLRLREGGSGVWIAQVLRGSVAEQAGFAAGDEWLSVQDAQHPERSAWRLGAIDELPLYAGKARRVLALVARDRRLLSLNLSLPRATTVASLAIRDAERAQQWLAAGAAH